MSSWEGIYGEATRDTSKECTSGDLHADYGLKSCIDLEMSPLLSPRNALSFKYLAQVAVRKDYMCLMKYFEFI
jgi:hypothetical protein